VTSRVVVRFRAGPTWTRGTPREQADWDAHAEFVDGLVARGIFVMGGPLSDNSGSLVLLERVTAAEAEELMRTDPFIENGVFVLDRVEDWTIYVDALTK
jgi:uncharacterized protein YciI